jgi:hypothetical protein
MKKPEKMQFMIQIERPNQKLSMDGIHKLLAPTGLELDPDYGPIYVNPQRGRVVVRGKGTDKARAEAEKISGIQLFRDQAVHPTKLGSSS